MVLDLVIHPVDTRCAHLAGARPRPGSGWRCRLSPIGTLDAERPGQSLVSDYAAISSGSAWTMGRRYLTRCGSLLAIY